MAATKKSEALEGEGIKKPSSEQKRNPDAGRASQEKRESMGTKKAKDSHETSLDHPQHSLSDYKRSHSSTSSDE